MKIKNDKKISRFPDRARAFVHRRKALVKWVSRFGAVVLAVVLVFSVFRYGIYLKEVGHTTYFNHALQRLIKMDFSFVGNYAKGGLAELDEVAFDIKFKHLLRLQYLREQSMKEGLILPEYKNEEFPAKLTHNGKTVDVKIALTGLVAKSHLRNPAKWSFEVKVKGDDTFMGMKRFAMLLPSTRGYLTDWIGFELMKSRGLTGLRVDFVNISINGKPTGIYYMEERFDKYLIENNRLREGIIFKIDEGLEPYRESKLMANPATRDQLLMIRRMYQQVMIGALPPGKLFDLKKMAQVYVICDLMNNKHPLAGQNLRYYFNPVTGLAEPIAREWEELHGEEEDPRSLFLEKPRPATRHFRFERLPFIRMIYDNLEFKRHYIREAAEVSQPQFLAQLLQRHEKKIDVLMKKVYRTWPFYEDPTKYLVSNQQYMRSVLFPSQDQLGAYFHHQDGNRLSVYLQNQQYMPLQVDYLSWRDSIRLYPEEPVELDSKVKVPKGEILSFHFRIPESLQEQDDWAGQLTAHYNLLGLAPGAKSTPVLEWADEDSVAQSDYGDAGPANYASFDFIVQDDASNAITIPAGSWAIAQDLAIPAGKRLVVAPGAQVSLANGARIISHSPVSFEGTKEHPILIQASDEAGGSILVANADERSYLSHTTFDGISGDVEEASAITFYKSPVTADNCIFSNNKTGQGFLHLIQSDLNIGYALFHDITGNAIDGDFCTGSANESSFVDISGNGIDLRGSDLVLSHLFMSAIGGENISAREESEVQARWINEYEKEAAAAKSEENPDL